VIKEGIMSVSRGAGLVWVPNVQDWRSVVEGAIGLAGKGWRLKKPDPLIWEQGDYELELVDQRARDAALPKGAENELTIKKEEEESSEEEGEVELNEPDGTPVVGTSSSFGFPVWHGGDGQADDRKLPPGWVDLSGNPPRPGAESLSMEVSLDEADSGSDPALESSGAVGESEAEEPIVVRPAVEEPEEGGMPPVEAEPTWTKYGYTVPMVILGYRESSAAVRNDPNWRRQAESALGLMGYRWGVDKTRSDWEEGDFRAKVWMEIWMNGELFWVETSGSNFRDRLRAELRLPEDGWALWRGRFPVKPKEDGCPGVYHVQGLKQEPVTGWYCWMNNQRLKFDHEPREEEIEQATGVMRFWDPKLQRECRARDLRRTKRYHRIRGVIVRVRCPQGEREFDQRSRTFLTEVSQWVWRRVNSWDFRDAEDGEILGWRALRENHCYEVNTKGRITVDIMFGEQEPITKEIDMNGDLEKQWHGMARKNGVEEPIKILRGESEISLGKSGGGIRSRSVHTGTRTFEFKMNRKSRSFSW
jgi:hypothetical protein